MYELIGQEEIIKAIDEDKPMKLWSLVKFIGYQKMPSINERKLVFLGAYKSFDRNVNNNFVNYYNKCIMYQSLIDWKHTTSILTGNARAVKHHNDKNVWPVIGDKSQDAINQSEHILDNFML